jgi:hypothetical protein
MQDIWDTMKKPNLQIMGVEGKEMQTKTTDNLVNRIIVSSRFRNLRNLRNLTEHQNIRTKKETLRHTTIKTLSTQNTERILKAAKRKDKSHVKAKPSEQQQISQLKL